MNLNTLKNKMVITPILVFSDSKKEFRVHVDTSFVALGVVLTHLGEGSIDPPISFTINKLSTVERNYTTTKGEGLAMVYALQKLWHYLIGGHINIFKDHSILKYLVKKLVLGGVFVGAFSFPMNLNLNLLLSQVD